MAASQGSDFALTPLDATHGPIVIEEVAERELAPALAARVLELFEAECRDRLERGIEGDLYDGRLFSLVEDPRPRLRGHFVAYSEWVAQLRDPALRSELGIRPLGVTGVVLCGDALWLGLRSRNSLLLPERWELCPSGGVDLDARDAAGRIDAQRQLGVELEQELAWPADRVRSAVPFALVEDLELAVVDIAYRLELDGTADALRARIDARENREYERIEAIPLSELAAFVDHHGQSVSPVSVVMLEVGGWL